MRPLRGTEIQPAVLDVSRRTFLGRGIGGLGLIAEAEERLGTALIAGADDPRFDLGWRHRPFAGIAGRAPTEPTRRQNDREEPNE